MNLSLDGRCPRTVRDVFMLQFVCSSEYDEISSLHNRYVFHMLENTGVSSRGENIFKYSML